MILASCPDEVEHEALLTDRWVRLSLELDKCHEIPA